VTSPIEVSPEDLRRHAGHLDGIADELATAKQAGEVTRPGMDAYGKLCWIVPAMLNEVQGPLVEGIAAAADSVRATADAVAGAAEQYAQVDAWAAGNMRTGGPGR
jgi:hypothetical protein